MELRLDKYMSVDSVKAKLATHCGTSVGDMKLQLFDNAKNYLATLGPDERLLGYYSPDDGYILHIQDTNPLSLSANGWLEDTSKVEKYVMSEEAYNAREGTYRKFKETKLKEDPEWTAEKELCMRNGRPYNPPKVAERVTDANHLAEEASGMTVGDRCAVTPGDKRGTVRYVGQCEGLPLGYWVGIEFDEPVGKNDGSVKGARYFTCTEGFGSFVRPTNVTVGDFPPVDEFALSDGDEI
ncbi:hypothetical protein WJX73_005164 [Symbiochloris irregularis]|uniref:CAP-Gly domain-containing protein n=1 Tax=Symbiochloris irregularis TaxID=706552 RepID=A0AAW1NN58_9CHLO